jgi:hypothetical protein
MPWSKRRSRSSKCFVSGAVRPERKSVKTSRSFFLGGKRAWRSSWCRGGGTMAATCPAGMHRDKWQTRSGMFQAAQSNAMLAANAVACRAGGMIGRFGHRA